MKKLSTIILLLFIIASFQPLAAEETEVLRGYEYDEVKARLSQTSLADIEGIWQFMPDGATVAVERAEVNIDSHISRYNVVIVSSVDDDVEDGTLIGHIYSSASATQFTAELYSDIHGDKSLKLKKYILDLTDKGRQTFNSGSNKVRLDFWRWLPYLFRISVVRDKKSANIANGCIKIYPIVPEARSFPIYL